MKWAAQERNRGMTPNQGPRPGPFWQALLIRNQAPGTKAGHFAVMSCEVIGLYADWANRSKQVWRSQRWPGS
jgi:hypothetical protein